MEPIVLNEFGEEIVENGYGEDEKMPLDASPMGLHIHDELSNHPVRYFAYLCSVSKTHNAVVCAKCGRIGKPIPKEIDTRAKLRQWCADEIKKQ